MDKNTLVGFGLLMLLLVGYIVYNQNAEKQYLAKRKADSIAQAKLNPPPVPVKTIDSSLRSNVQTDSLKDTLQTIQAETFYVIENKDLQITFTNKGGSANKVLLKQFKTYDGKPLILFEGNKNFIDLGYKSTAGMMIHTKDEYFNGEIRADKRQIVLKGNNTNITYQLPETGCMLEMKVDAKNTDKSAPVSLQWNSQSIMTEKDVESQRMYTQVCYNLEKEGYDYYTIKEKEDKNFNEAVKWLSFKQHYFNTTLITDQKLITSAKISSDLSKEDTATRKLSDFSAYMTLLPQDNYGFKMYLGPNDYKILKSYQIELEEIIPLSYGIFGFVKYINKWIILPIFNMLSHAFSSYGVVILLLTFIIRLLMSPFTYKSYVSSAKMKALKPELDELREKMGEDKQAFGMEQMKLYRQAGVNPLGGCLPALLQLPVFFALLSFFPHAIELRQEKFLWANDLSTYDSILNLPFTIPFYGDHISLFTILFVITSLLMALYSMNMTADQNNPMMKYLPFIMPVMFLGIFNKLPAALTFYYFVSNVITLGLQFVIQQWIIDPKKIHAQIQAKKNEPPKENKLMKKMMEMQKQNEERMKKGGKK